jgi:hypothetical protein
VAYLTVDTSLLGLLPALWSDSCAQISVEEDWTRLYTEAHTMTLPSGSKLAVEWYNRGIVVLAKPVVNRLPSAAEGVYSQGVKTE